MNAGLMACEFELAIEDFQAQRLQAASDRFAGCLERSASDETLLRAESHFYLGIVARQQGDLEVSVHHLTQAREMRPDQIFYALELAVSTERTGSHQQALDIYQQVLGVENHPGARLGEARMMHWMGHVSKAVALYRVMLTDQPADTGARIGLGHALLGDHQKQAAKEQFRSVLQQQPDHQGARQGMEMAESQYNHRLKITHGIDQTATGDNHSSGIELFVQPRKAYQWGLIYSQAELPLSPPQDNGIPVFRAVRNNLSGFLKFNRPSGDAWSLGYARQDLQNGYQQRFSINHAHRFKEKHQWLWGLEYIDVSEAGEAYLFQASWVYQSTKHTSLLSQLFLSHDSAFGDSQALSLSAIHSWPDRLMLHGGLSHSRAINQPSWTGFLKAEVPFGDQWRLGLGVVNNFTNSDRSVTGAVTFHF
ncbi:hypothetical protein ACFODZ_14900 [Marinicella sediminis]|uniref:Surface lipoprotein assembly modifier N-terminal TPR repeats region domain-containing protein n=1 Tax=Marinicella sediminis TaxID=1792834 RepID=A0ABV7JBU7_9GAMM|nr:hypothetical protein [Marinicella sediminis]